MGHSKDMSETYTHLDDEDVKKMLKEQVYKLEELPPEKKAELQKQIDDLKKQNESMLKMFDEHTKIINEKYRIKMFEENKKLAKKYLK